MEGKALRHNHGKLQYDLLDPFAVQELVRVFTKGAEKYERNNWKRGMKWSKMIASAKRHLAAFEAGEDFDPELGTYHLANAAWNLLGVVSFYKIFPQGDDRDHTYLTHPKIGLDIDEVLCDWVGEWSKKFGMELPESWFFDRDIMTKFNDLKEKGELNSFYAGLSPKIKASEIPFEPHCYVTSRPVPTEVTEAWLDKHGFPSRPVYTVGLGESKVEVIKKSGTEIFVDDRFDNFTELNRAGICTFLMDAKHNQRYNVGYKRIKHLNELFER